MKFSQSTKLMIKSRMIRGAQNRACMGDKINAHGNSPLASPWHVWACMGR
jgi:hypothetical protein